MEVHLVADTNLFFECKALEDLPWHELGFDPVVILVTKPVLDEIDKHKKGTGRTRGRALDIFGRIRAMLTAGVQEVDIQAAGPQVILRRAGNVKPDQNLKDDLDYSRTDEKLVGIVSSLNAQASGYEVKLFTDDTGPSATADGLGVPYLMINETWRRPPSESTEDKQIKDLQKDLAAYRSQEPAIKIGPCEPADSSGEVLVTRRIATPLTEDEISGLLDTLRQKHPLKTNFDPPTPSSSTEPSGEVVNTHWEAPKAEAISAYQEVQYPQWLEGCRGVLVRLHEGRDETESSVVLRWIMSNDGTRPASAVRVEFEAQGPLQLCRLPDEEEAKEGDDEEVTVTAKPAPRLPAAPRPPAFEKHITRVPAPDTPQRVRGLDISTLKAAGLMDDRFRGLTDASKALRLAGLDTDQFKGLRAITDAAAGLHRHSELFDAARLSGLMGSGAFAHLSPPPPVNWPSMLPRVPQRRDPEAFYYDWSATMPVKKGALTCELWRHQTGKEAFEFEVLFTKEGEVRGSVLCTVHAENLTKPEQARVTVRRKVESFSVFDLATRLVESSA